MAAPMSQYKPTSFELTARAAASADVMRVLISATKEP
jgi:hypothetical protein